MGNATLLYDDVTGYEFEEFVKKIKPDLIGSGIKEKYIFQKMGIPFRQMHSWDYSGPVPRLRRLRHLRPRHGHDHQRPCMGPHQDALEVAASAARPWRQGRGWPCSL